MPTLAELTALFDIYPEVPPPPPRRRGPPQVPGKKSENKGTPEATSTAMPASATPSTAVVLRPTVGSTTPLSSLSLLLQSIILWMLPHSQVKKPQLSTLTPPRKPNPFAALKAGRKLVIIAVVDNGNVGFFRFSEGVFGEWKMA
jgi:tRNA-splicing endonuclease subunit Sen54